MMSASNCQVVAPAQVWSAAPTLSPRVKRLRDQYWSFYERDYTNEARSYTTGTPWDIVYSIWSWTNVPEVAMFQPDARAGILVIAPELRGWILKGDFVEFQRTDPYVERQMGSSLLRYNAYTGVRNAGVTRVRSVEGSFAISRLQVAKDFALARLAAIVQHQKGGIAIPLAVRREFARMVAVKVLAWIGEDGYPSVIPMLSLQPAGDRSLVCWQGSSRLASLPADAGEGFRLVASNILTFEAISYQAKGHWSARGRQGAIAVQEVYAGGPPYPGGRVA